MKQRYTVELGAELHKQAKVKAAQDGISLASVLRRLLLSWLCDDVLPDIKDKGCYDEFASDEGTLD